MTAADTGRYLAADGGGFRLFVADGHVYVQWMTARTAHYAIPVGRDSLVVRADRSTVVVERDAAGRAVALGRSWGGSLPARYVRQ